MPTGRCRTALEVEPPGCDRTNQGQGCPPQLSNKPSRLIVQRNKPLIKAVLKPASGQGGIMTVGNFEFVRSEQPALAQLLCDAERWLDQAMDLLHEHCKALNLPLQ